MKALLIFVGLAAFTAASRDPGMRIRFDINPFTIGSDHFYDVPRTTTEAIAEGWEQKARADGPLSGLVLYCLNDNYNLCALYDPDATWLCGLQYGLAKDKTSNLVFDMDTQGYREWTISGSAYYILDAYYVPQNYFETTVADRIANYDSSKLLQYDALWLTGIDGEIDEVPTTESGIVASGFTKQACIPLMGTHYYKNMSPTTECNSKSIYPWFCFVDSGELIGFAPMFFGTLTSDSEEREWRETPAQLAVKAIVNSGPQCLYDIAGTPGVRTCHSYIIEKPWQIGCSIFG